MKLRIDKAIYGGDGLARNPEGKTVFVPGALPGELVEASVLEEKRGFSQSRLDAILEASAERILPECEYVPRCGGCQYQHANVPYQLQMKLDILRETFSRGHVPVPEEIGALTGPPWGYRNRIRLHAMKSGVGYRQRASHNLLPVSHCPIAAPLLEEAILVLAGTDVTQFCDEVELFTNGEELLVSFLSPPRPTRNEFTERLQAQLPKLTRQPSLTYSVAGNAYRVSRGSFFQVNRFLLPELLQLVLAWSGSGKVAWDLYSGAGLFAKVLEYEQVIAVETAGPSAQDLQHNLTGKQHRIVRSETLEFLRKPARVKPDLILVDPPRAGLGKDVCALLADVGAASMVYVSCDPTTLVRDLQLLLQFYSLEKLNLVDLFPQTFHLETVCLLKRN